MRAMILAAGLGTRLAPLTERQPKALVPLAGRPLIEHLLLKLERQGFDQIAVNTHAFADQLQDFVHRYRRRSRAEIYISHETELLDTGGGIRKMMQFFPGDQPVLVHNVDILSDFDLCAVIDEHRRLDSEATLLLYQGPTARPLCFDENMMLVGRGSAQDPPHRLFGFCGIQVVQPDLFRNQPEKAFYVIDFYIQKASEGRRIMGLLPAGRYWRDVGTVQDLQAAENDLVNGTFS